MRHRAYSIFPIILVAVLLGILAPEAAQAAKYNYVTFTDPGITVTGQTYNTINISVAYTLVQVGSGQPTDQANTIEVQWQTTGSGLWDHTSGAVTQSGAVGANTYPYQLTGLSASTTYDIRVIHVDLDGVGQSGPPTSATTSAVQGTTTAAPVNTTAPGTVTLSVVSDTQINVTMPYTDNANYATDGSNCTVEYNTANSWPGTPAPCSPVSGASPRTCSITNLLPGTLYYVRVIYVDTTDGISGGQPATQVVSNTTTYTGIGVGTVTTGTVSDTSVVVNAPVDSTNSDTDNNATVQYQYMANPPGSWTNFGSAVNAKTNQSMPITGLTASTPYDFRVVWTDGGGVYNMSTKASLGSPYNSNTASATTTSGTVCVSTIASCSDCHGMPPTDWDGVSPKTGTTGSQGDHGVPAHTGDGARDKCARCHYDYVKMANVTSAARWTFAHTNARLDIYTSNHVANNIYASPYDKGIKGGYYKGYRGNSLIFSGGTPGTNDVCAATYCHGAGDSPVWGTGGAACGSCHDVPPPIGAGKHSTHNNGFVGYKNNSNGTTYDFGCYKCHDPGAHANGPVSSVQAAPVAFDNVSAPLNPSGSYTAGGSAAGTDGVYNWTNGTCTSLYCHSNGAGSNVNDPTWNGGSLGCTGCHNGLKTDVPNQMQTGTHNNHINNTDAYLASFTCDECHNATTTTGNTITNTANHVNETPDVAFSGGGSWNGTNCSGTACHTNGRADNPTDLNPIWGGTAIVCNGCHGTDNYYTDINGRPDYQNISTATRGEFNGHYVGAHVSSAADCIKCHNATVDSGGAIKASSAHLDGQRTVSFAVSGTYSNKRCSGTDSTNCHGSVTPRWGGKLTCYDCHIDTGAIGTENDDYNYGTAPKATINELEWQNAGHGRSGSNYLYTNNPPANFGDCTTNCHTYSVGHNDTFNPFRLISSATIRPSDPSTLCTSCHSTSTTNHHNKTVLDANHLNPDAIWSFVPKCIDCHDPHGDNGGVTTNQYNAAMIHSAVNSSGSNAYGVPTGTTAVDFPTGFPGGSFVWGSFVDSTVTPSNNGLCQVCHDAGDNVNWFNKTTYTTHNEGTVCNSCHTHDKGFAGAGGDCKSCHNSQQNGRPSMQTEFGRVSHHINVAWASISSSTCSVCHLEGNADGTYNTTYHNKPSGGPYPVDLRVITAVGSTEALTIANNTAGIQFFTGNGPNGGTRSAEYTANTFCLGCHDTANASTNPFNGSESGGSLKAPSAYDGSYGSIEARYADTGTTTSHPYNPSTFNVVPNLTKAYSPHGNPQNNQMKNVVSGGWVNDSQTSANAVGCLDCHNSHGSDALADDGTNFNGITYSSSMGGYKGGLLKTTSTYDPDETTAYSAGSDLCFDCHINTGSGLDSTAPKHASNFGVAATRNVHEYYDAGRWTTSDTWSPTFSYKTGGTGNGSGSMKGGHFGASSALANMPDPTHRIDGSCMTCHDPHGTPTGGYRGTGTTRARMAPALKGTWMSSPYKEDRVASASMVDTNSYGATIDSKGSGNEARIAPNLSLNNPSNLGAGFGQGNSAFGTYAAGGSGTDGYFIDDNTFGTTYATSTNNNPWRDNGAISATHISQTAADFGGLCLDCHTETNLKALSYSNGTDNIKVHNTVAGWYNPANAADLFKNIHANQHSMAYYNQAPTTSNRCTSALWTIPAGYRWSVNPGSQTSVGQASGNWGNILSQMTQPPHDTGGQTQIGYTQTSFHQFPCSKCHAPHASKLPRLMKTNCLDVGEGNVSEGGNPKHNTGYAFSGCADGATANYKPMICHGMGPGGTGAGNTGSTSNDGGWNIKTGW